MQRQPVYETEGTIVLVQEDRFRLETLDGRSLLLILSPSASASMRQLESLAGSHRMVKVRYYGQPDAGAVAVEVRPF